MTKWPFVIAVLASLYGAFSYWAGQPVVFGGAVLVTGRKRKSTNPLSFRFTQREGASSGIGRHAAFFLARHNLTVFATCRKEEDKASLLQEAKAAGLEHRLVPITLHVDSEQSCRDALRRIREAKLPLVALVNNAGVGGGSPAELEDEQRLRDVFETNFFGAMRLAKLALPLLRESKGRIVSISSLKGSVATPGSSSYSASKAALDMALRVMALEVYHQGIKVVTVQPGYIKSEIRTKVDPNYLKKALELENVHHYPGFLRYVEDLSLQPTRGVDPIVTSKSILHGIVARFPGPLLRAGGWEVVSATWLPWLIPDWFEDDISAALFQYDRDGKQEMEKNEGWFAKFKESIGILRS